MSNMTHEFEPDPQVAAMDGAIALLRGGWTKGVLYDFAPGTTQQRYCMLGALYVSNVHQAHIDEIGKLIVADHPFSLSLNPSSAIAIYNNTLAPDVEACVAYIERHKQSIAKVALAA